MKLRFSLFFLFVCTLLNAQKAASDSTQNPGVKRKITPPKYELPNPREFGSTILASDLKSLIFSLASDTFQGRETGEPGQQKAAAFIAEQFRQAGIAPKGERNTYFQPTLMERAEWDPLTLSIGDTEFKNRSNFYLFPSLISDIEPMNAKEWVFLGYGIEDEKYNDYQGTDVKGKAVVFYDGEPMDANEKSLITGTEFRSPWSVSWKKKVELAQKKGATLVFIIDPKISDNLKKNRKQTTLGGWRASSGEMANSGKLLPVLFISPELATALFGGKAEKIAEAMADLQKSKGFKPVKFKSKVKLEIKRRIKRLQGSNVLAVIEGSDSIMKKEYVFVTAHYDHLGMSDSSRIFYGADDNASGSSGLIEIARAFQAAKNKGAGPKRTVVCMLVSGEEKGLLGSQYYVEFPLFPLNKTVVDINIDMIGRIDNRHQNGNYVYSIGSDRLSSELLYIVESNNYYYTHLELDYTYDDLNDPNKYYERSDHYNFAERGVPAVFFFNGTHDDYHQTTDTPDKINLEALQQRARLAFYTAWEIANRPAALWPDRK